MNGDVKGGSGWGGCSGMGGQGGCEQRRIEVFVTIQQKKIGGGGGSVPLAPW